MFRTCSDKPCIKSLVGLFYIIIHVHVYTGFDSVLSNLVDIVRSLKLSRGARVKLTLHFKQNKWLEITENPTEDELVTLALERIKQDPSEYDLFVSMLCDIEGMDQIARKITSGECRAH